MSSPMAPVIGVLGGSGVYDIDGLTTSAGSRSSRRSARPPTSCCSASWTASAWCSCPRHGRGHRIPPDEINYRANIDALKRSGVTDLISVSAVGSLREELPPGTFVIVDQFIDRTFARNKSFFGTGLVAHVSMAHPVCAAPGRSPGGGGARGGDRGRARRHLPRDGRAAVLEPGRVELYRSWGCDVIGMTNMPEAKLAREAEICYATVAMVTDFDCWHPEDMPRRRDGQPDHPGAAGQRRQGALCWCATWRPHRR